MRDKTTTSVSHQLGSKVSLGVSADAREVACDELKFFESFYAATVRGEPTDRMTIGSISEPESRFHYNAVENAIIRAISHHEPLPQGVLVEAWRFMQQRRELRVLDIGSGTGHWIDFFRNVYCVKQAVGIEFSASMVGHLRDKYRHVPEVEIQETDIARSGLTADDLGGTFDFISAIGVMFHIVDDERWSAALRNLARVLKPSGLLLVGGEFGTATRNVQFHKTDVFRTWKEHAATEATAQVRVHKRVRSLAHWQAAAASSGLEMFNLIRSDADPRIMTPENDVLVLRPASHPSPSGESHT